VAWSDFVREMLLFSVVSACWLVRSDTPNIFGHRPGKVEINIVEKLCIGSVHIRIIAVVWLE
jgi:hypothetical protein